MLEGKNDTASLDRYIKDFGGRYAETDGTLHGAYGYRWIHGFGFNQLDVIVKRLEDNPNDRQCVLAMWDATNNGEDDLAGVWKDRPCNTHVYFRLRNKKELDITVCCRSNDMIWGAYGANIVQFGVLHRYMAARLEAEVGVYYQISNNYHAYLNVFAPLSMRIQKLSTPPDGRKWTQDPLFTLSDAGPAHQIRAHMNYMYYEYKARRRVPLQDWCAESEWLRAAAAWVDRRLSK
jgi:thymidylate synthase